MARQIAAWQVALDQEAADAAADAWLHGCARAEPQSEAVKAANAEAATKLAEEKAKAKAKAVAVAKARKAKAAEERAAKKAAT